MIKFRILLFTASVLALLLSSCRDCVEGSGVLYPENRTSTISDFTEIEANSDFDVYITMDSITQVVVEGDDNIVPYIKTFVSGDRLIIENRSKKCFDYSQRMEVHIRIPFVDKVVLNGSGNVYCYNWSFYGANLSILNSGSGDMVFENTFTDETVVAKLFGSGDIKITGEGDNAEYYISGSGNIKAISFIADEAYSNSSGSGNIYVAFLDELTVDLTGSGSVFFRGDDRRVFTKITGSGDVREY